MFYLEYFSSSLNPTLDNVVPGWAFAYAGATVLFYVMMDAIDGMQARRTKSSSPLGQLFDHGCDCATTTVFSIMMINGLGVGSSWRSVALMAAVQVAFFLSQWEEKYTGICRTCVGGVFGVTESQLMLAGQMFISAWDPLIGSRIVYGEIYTLQDAWFYLYVGFMVFISITCILGVIYKYGGDRMQAVGEMARELSAIVSVNICVVLCGYVSSISQFEYLLIILCLAFCNSFSTIRVILSGISHTKFPLYHPVAFPLYAIVFARWLTGPGPWTQLVLAIYFGALMHHIISRLVHVTNEIAAYLGIYVFDIVNKRD